MVESVPDNKARDLVFEIIATHRSRAAANLDTLDNLLEAYFDTGPGKSLSEGKQAVIRSGARWRIFRWSGHNLIDDDVVKTRIEVPIEVETDILRQELGIQTFEQIWDNLQLLQLSGNQKGGLERRTQALAKRAINTPKNQDN